MATLKEIREQHPEYNDMSDHDLTDRIYNKYYKDMPRDKFNEKIGYSPPSGVMDFFQSIPRGLVQGAVGAATSMGQAEAPLSGMTEEQVKAVPGADQAMGILEHEVIPPMHKPQTTAGQYGASVGEAVGNPASYVGPGGLPAKIGYAALSGAGAEAGGQLTGQSPLGRIGGAVAAALAPRGATRLLSPSTVPAARQADVGALRAAGVEPSAGDITGSARVRNIEKMGDLPGGGKSYSANQESSAAQFTQAVARKMGIEGELAAPEVLARADSEIEARFQEAAEGSRIKLDQKYQDGIVSVIEDAVAEGLSKDIVDRLYAQIKTINEGFVTQTRGGTFIPGSKYYEAVQRDSALDRAIRGSDEKMAYYAGRIRNELDEALQRSATARGTRPGVGRRQAAEDIIEAQRQYWTMQVIRRSLGKTGGGVEGLIDPRKLRRNLTDAPDAATRFAVNKLRELGETDLFELSRAGNTVLRPNQAPSESGHGYTIAGVASGLMGRAANSTPGQFIMSNQHAVPLREATPPGYVAAPRAAIDADTQSKHSRLPSGWTVEQVH
jgi:hypothetical protein